MQPHPLLRVHYQSTDEKQRFLRQMFDQSAPYYEAIIHWSSFGTGLRYRREALERGGLKGGMRVLDVGTGSGTTARAAAGLLGNARYVVGLDPSLGMLCEARRRLALGYLQGEADHLPLRDAAVDFLVMAYALRHVESLATTFAQYYRVLKPGGAVLILEVTKPDHRLGGTLVKFYFRDIVPWFTRHFTRSRTAGELMRYHWETIEQMVPPAQVLRALAAAGFTNVRRYVALGLFSEYTATKP